MDRGEERFEIKPTHLIGDAAHGTAEMPGWTVDETAIEPHVPGWDKAARKDGSSDVPDFRWEAKARLVPMPTGQARNNGLPASPRRTTR